MPAVDFSLTICAPARHDPVVMLSDWPVSGVTTQTENRQGMSAEEAVLNIILGVAGAFTYDQLRVIVTAIRDRLAALVASADATRSEIVATFQGVKYVLRNDADIATLVDDIKEALPSEKASDTDAGP